MIDITSKESIIEILESKDTNQFNRLIEQAYNVKVSNLGNKVYLRGLIEISNICAKNCLYCGLRNGNSFVSRYELTESQILEAAEFAYRSNYGSLVLQAGERCSSVYVDRVTKLIESIKEISNGRLGITLSLGEQSYETYKNWFEAGAHRYLLRIESSNPILYSKIHPNDNNHLWDNRVSALKDLKDIGYQTGTGIMIGLPGQSYQDLAEDLLFIKNFGIHMVGMGPYLRHSQTPMGKEEHTTTDLTLTLKMVAILRLMMPRINIAATTAMQVVDSIGRERAIFAGANVIMPNMTLVDVRKEYQIYNNKPGIEDDALITKSKLEENLSKAGIEIGWGEWGDPQAYFDK